MKASYTILFILFTVVSFLFSCNNEKDTKPSKTTSKETKVTDAKQEVVFYINDRPVTRGRLYGANLETAINNEIIYEMALKENLHEQQEIKDRVELFKKNIIVGKIKFKLIKEYLANNPVTDDQIDTYYEQIKHKYSRLDLTHIMLDDEETANNIHKLISNAENIEGVLEEQKESGINIVTKNLNETRNYDKYFKSGLEVGKISDPIKGTNKYNIYKIENITYTPLEQIKQQLRYQLTSKNRLKAVNQYVEKSKKENNFNIKKVN